MAMFKIVVDDAVEVLTNNPMQAIVLEGAPGGGKTACSKAIASALTVPEEAQIMFRPSTKDETDLSGLPDFSEEEFVYWKPAEVIYRLNEAAEKFGKAFLTIDELGHSTVRMYNGLAGLMLDNEIGGHKLDPRVYKFATTNRTEDKAGVTRMPTHMANRLVHFALESNLDGWVDWALDARLPMWLIAFLRFKPQLLNDFDPSRKVNPTERMWELLSKAIRDTTPDDRFFRISEGMVGAGAAAELAAFKSVMYKLPSVDQVLLSPKDFPIPDDEPAVMFALMGALAANATKDNFDRTCTYLLRCPPEFQVLSVKDSMKLHPEVKQTRAFVEWSVKNKSVFM